MTKLFGALFASVVLGTGGPVLAHDMAQMKHVPTQINAPAPNTVEIENFNFGPAVLIVSVGTAVSWINRDNEPHTVVSADNPRLFRSAALDTGDRFTFTFSTPGTYKYFCSIHPHMTGTVVVK